MAIRQTGFESYLSTVTGRTYETELAARHYEKEFLQASAPESEGSKLLDLLTTEQLRSLAIEVNIRNDQPERNQDWREIQETFVRANPDFLANPQNGATLAATLVERGLLLTDGTYLGTMDDLQDCYGDLARRNMLQTPKGAPRPKRIDMDAAYEMPIGDLLNKARGW